MTTLSVTEVWLLSKLNAFAGYDDGQQHVLWLIDPPLALRMLLTDCNSNLKDLLTLGGWHSLSAEQRILLRAQIQPQTALLQLPRLPSM